MHLTRLTNLLSKSSHGHFTQSTAVHSKELASQSVGIKNDTLALNGAMETTLVNKTFKDHYDLKISQGRHHYNALGHVAHKLVRIIHKMMSTNAAFNLA